MAAHFSIGILAHFSISIYIPCTIQLPKKVIAAYQAGVLPLNTLANAILAKSDQTKAMMGRNFEEHDRENISRSRGIQ